MWASTHVGVILGRPLRFPYNDNRRRAD